VPESLPVACIAVDVPEDVKARLATVCTPQFITTEEVPGAIREAEGLLCPAPFPITPQLLDSAPHLRVVSNFGVGFNNVDLIEMARRGIAVCNTPGVLSAAVADLTLGMIVMASRGLVANATYVSSGGWANRAVAPGLGWDLEGKTLGLVGFGRIAKAVAVRARTFGFRILFYDTFTDPGSDWRDCQYRSLEDLLAESDVVSVHVNLTEVTHHLIGAAALARMKRTAWLINTARGPVVDQPALTAALQSNTIAGAVLDVLEVEPPAKDDPILGLANAVILPHIGSATVETRAAMLDLSVRNLMAVLSGTPPPECVNPETLERALARR
jgi:glyoxylate reductase